MTAAVIVTDLRKTYRDTVAVDRITLTIEEGETVGIVGPNGAGKTTTVESIQGLRRPDSGTVSVLGFDPRRDRAAVRSLVGCQLQSAGLQEAITVAEAMRLYASFYPDPAPVGELIEAVGLTGKAGARYATLSGGQKQRLSLALALVGRPRVAILDELTTGLDPHARREVWALIEQLKDQGTTVLLVTHFMEEAERLCDRVVVIDHGRVVAEGTPEELAASTGGTNLDDAYLALTAAPAPVLPGITGTGTGSDSRRSG